MDWEYARYVATWKHWAGSYAVPVESNNQSTMMKAPTFLMVATDAAWHLSNAKRGIQIPMA